MPIRNVRLPILALLLIPTLCGAPDRSQASPNACPIALTPQALDHFMTKDALVVSTLRLEKYSDQPSPLNAMFQSFADYGSDYQKARVEMYHDLLNRFGYVVDHANGASQFHGAAAPALLSVLNVPGRTPKGLVPTGLMLKQGLIPFSGELLSGINPEIGVNQDAVSSTSFVYIDYAISYAQGTPASAWTPEKSQALVSSLSGYAATDSSPEAVATQAMSEIEHRRQEAWANLTALEKTLIQTNFPVLFGIKMKDASRENPQPSRYGSWETLLSGGVGPDEIKAIFVPAQYVGFVRANLPPGSSIQVSALEPVSSAAIERSEFIQRHQDGIAEGD